MPRLLSRPEFENLLEFQLKALGAPPCKREYQFAISMHRRFRADLAYPMHRLLVEIQGGIWNGGKHGRASGVVRDIERMQYAAILGWRVLPVTTDQVRSGTAAQLVLAALDLKELSKPVDGLR